MCARSVDPMLFDPMFSFTLNRVKILEFRLYRWDSEEQSSRDFGDDQCIAASKRLDKRA